MCAVWSKLLLNDPTTTSKSGIDVFAWLGRATLDIIGLAGTPILSLSYPSLDIRLYPIAGFGYDFNALNLDEETNELSAAFSTLFKFSEGISMLAVLQIFVPVLRHIVRILLLVLLLPSIHTSSLPGHMTVTDLIHDFFFWIFA